VRFTEYGNEFGGQSGVHSQIRPGDKLLTEIFRGFSPAVHINVRMVPKIM